MAFGDLTMRRARQRQGGRQRAGAARMGHSNYAKTRPVDDANKGSSSKADIPVFDRAAEDRVLPRWARSVEPLDRDADDWLDRWGQ